MANVVAVDPNAPASAAASTAEAERAALLTFYRAFSERRPELVDEAVTQDWEDIPLPPGHGLGPESIKPILRAFFEAFPDVHLAVLDILQEPGRAAVRSLLTGTHRGTFLGVAPTGKEISVACHDFHALRNGRIARTWHLEDWFTALAQIGAWPPAR
ncbi:ester cyclase [Sorangium sp. So ce296]|uniref:ester cyclase n=1 Tax=Sorangium sp. So ce296 TaxID=3133296 RepID=UPI003F61154B